MKEFEKWIRKAENDLLSITNNFNAKEKLGWSPTRSIEDIMRTAWEWEKKRSEVAV